MHLAYQSLLGVLHSSGPLSDYDVRQAWMRPEGYDLKKRELVYSEDLLQSCRLTTAVHAKYLTVELSANLWPHGPLSPLSKKSTRPTFPTTLQRRA